MNAHASSNIVPDMRPPQSGALATQYGYFVVGAGPPIVLLHSSLSSKSQWTALAERLRSRFCVIALDLCGYGDSAMPVTPTSFTLDDEARLVADRLDLLVEPSARVHLVGHSYGGLVALRFAQCRRDRVASLSLYEPVAFGVLDEQDTALISARQVAERVGRLIAAGCPIDATRAFVDFWSGEGSYASLPLPVQTRMADRIDKVPLDFQAVSHWAPDPAELRAITAPTLLLGGNRSPAVVQRIVTVLTRALPDNLRPGALDAGHLGPITDPARINPWIEAFVDICAEREIAPTAAHHRNG